MKTPEYYYESIGAYRPDIRCLDKYFIGNFDFSTEDRLRAMYRAKDLAASDLTGYLMCSVLVAAGGMEPNKFDIWRSYDLLKSKEVAASLSGIDMGRQ